VPQPNWSELRKHRIFLTSPLYGNMLHFGFFQSVMNLSLSCWKSGIHLGAKFVGCDSLVPRARNRCAAYFLDTEDTDLFFVDSDISFTVEDFLSVVEREEPILGGVYPRKQLDWNRIASAAKAGIPPDQLPHYGYIPVMNWQGEGDYSLYEPMEVKHLGTGFMRIKREVLTSMITQLGETIAFDYHTDEPKFKSAGYDLFPTGIDIRYPLGSGGRQYLSEDWGFCELARKCGFKTYAAPWVELVHSGYMDYSGSLDVMDFSIEEMLREKA
jgi:hypothetical protein